MTVNIYDGELKELKPRIVVMGVGGAGGNAINGMIESGLKGIEFVAVNTDAQDLRMNKAQAKIQLGVNLTRGLGAGAQIDIGQASADEALNDIVNHLQGCNMVFITAGMGGGTGTGAAHVIARTAKELNVLTVGVVTLPFLYEGPSRMKRALHGLEELKKHVDTNIVIPNQNLFKIANEKTTFEESFELSNRVLLHGVQSVTDLMTRPGLINLDFADVETVMSGMGKAMMGTGEAEGDKRASEAAALALNNPLIDEYSLQGARGLLINITGGKDLTLFEVDEAVNKIRAEVDPGAELIIGAITDTSLDGKMRVSIVATALDGETSEARSVVSMVHRIQSRNIGHTENHTSPILDQQKPLNATDGATALKLNLAAQPNTVNEIIQNKEVTEQSVGNISMENANYLQNIEDTNTEKKDEDIPTFEVDSIEQIKEETPQLFSDDENINLLNQNKLEEKEIGLFDEKRNEDEDFEIPAFLRKQKN